MMMIAAASGLVRVLVSFRVLHVTSRIKGKVSSIVVSSKSSKSRRALGRVARVRCILSRSLIVVYSCRVFSSSGIWSKRKETGSSLHVSTPAGRSILPSPNAADTSSLIITAQLLTLGRRLTSCHVLPQLGHRLVRPVAALLTPQRPHREP